MQKIRDYLGIPKFVTREKAIVIDTRDPYFSGKIRCQIVSTGNSPWIPYLMPPNMYMLPKVNDIVYVECEDGDPSYIIAEGKYYNPVNELMANTEYVTREVPTVSAWLSNGPLNSSGQAIKTIGPNGFIGQAILLDDGQQAYGQLGTHGGATEGIKILSYGGSKIILSDTTGQEKILLADVNNTSTPLVINASTGNFILIDSANNIITIQDNLGNQVSLGSSSIIINGVTKSVQIESATSVTINSATCTITTSGVTTVNASEVDVTAPTVDVTSSAMVTMTTPMLAVTGLITCSGIATGGAPPVAGNAVLSGSLMAGGDVADSAGNMALIRSLYDVHTHAVTTAPGTTSVPTPTM